ncbi:phage regulatory CII family protein [Roseateles cavernae]|uniref:phage regulatory CII family protein n=1 Tax=Roseateles cavernae TaxID=3153578 RepID=UPI0032E526E0
MTKPASEAADLAGMNLVDVAGLVVRDYGGARAMAARLGKAPGSLSHELNPPEGSAAKLGLLTAEEITQKARDYRILLAFAQNCGFMAVPIVGALGTDAAISDCAADVMDEAADVVRSIARALRGDDAVSDNELAEILKQWAELLALGPRLFRALAANNLRHGGQGLQPTALDELQRGAA